MGRKRRRAGFTLIEILVVIAIIGVLASIIIVSLTAATKKANNAKVKAQVEQARNAAQIYYSTNFHYGKEDSDNNSCDDGPPGPNADSMFDDTVSNMDFLVDEDNYPSNTSITCRSNADNNSDADEYAVSATLVGGDGGAPASADNWCIDSTGFSGAIALPVDDTTCN